MIEPWSQKLLFKHSAVQNQNQLLVMLSSYKNLMNKFFQSHLALTKITKLFSCYFTRYTVTHAPDTYIDFYVPVLPHDCALTYCELSTLASIVCSPCLYIPQAHAFIFYFLL